jgi:acetyl-CoA acyltransferase
MYWGTRADDLAVKAMKALIDRNPQIPVDRYDDVAIAATTQQGDQGLTLGRTTAILAGLPLNVPGLAIERMCAGALTASALMGSTIGFGQNDVVIAGGVEHMGHHPMGQGVDPNPRFLSEQLVDAEALNMGNTAERLHDRYPQYTKERADRFALASQQKAAKAYEDGNFARDLVPVAIESEAGWGLADRDEHLRPDTTMEGLAGLKTPFRPHGRVTAGNASPLTDGATASILVSDDALKEFGLKSRVEPEVMGLGPIPSTEKALKRAGLKIDDIGLFELNEAFAVQVLSFLDHFGIADDDPAVNRFGGAIALGHPLAASGVRLMMQLANQFEQFPEVRYGVTALCVGLGQGGTIIWENPSWNGKKHARAGK